MISLELGGGAVKDVLVVGGGTAGFMAALALKTKLPHLHVTVVRSVEIGVIGVGEGTTPPFTQFIHNFLGIPHTEFVKATRPGIKTGTRFHWGPREKFFFPLGPHMELVVNGMRRPIGYFLDCDNPDFCSPGSARMAANRPFGFNEKGSLVVRNDYAYHIENDRLAAFLESSNRALGVTIVDGTIETARADDRGIAGVVLTDGRTLWADLYIDCTGFRSLLLGQTLQEPRIEYNRTLYCDRAVVGGWVRPAGEPMLSYTVSETMDAGWCWRIDHPDRVNRGYVYSSAFISDDAAEQELRNKNPAIGPTRIVKFRSGRYQRGWVKNVIALGNASGFVEPLEATSLAIVASRSHMLVDLLIDSDGIVSDPVRRVYNLHTGRVWDAVRDFLSLHYRFNTRLETPFWRQCRSDIDMGSAQAVVEYYRSVGPSPVLSTVYVEPGVAFDIHSYFAILTGQKVPSEQTWRPTPAETEIWTGWCRHNATTAGSGATTEQALAILAGGRPV